MLDRHLTWPMALLLSSSLSCASVPDRAPSARGGIVLGPNSSPDRIHGAATLWLENRALAHDQRALTLLPRSYPEADTGLEQRHYLYDAALTLIWATETGRADLARRLARELVDRQREDGRWPDALVVDGEVETTDSYPAGVTAWVGYALAHFDANLGSSAARESARKSADALTAGRIPGPDECGHLVRSRVETDPIAVTEHQFDVVQLLGALGMRDDAAHLLDDIMACLWLDDERRFATAATPQSLHEAPALDAAGGWGALVLSAVDRSDLAAQSLDYTVDEFGSYRESLLGFRPYSDAATDLVFYEGTLGVALAAHRLERRALARASLDSARRAAITHQGGVPYASAPAPGFSDSPSVAATVWFLLADREIRDGLTAPFFADALSNISGAYETRSDLPTR